MRHRSQWHKRKLQEVTQKHDPMKSFFFLTLFNFFFSLFSPHFLSFLNDMRKKSFRFYKDFLLEIKSEIESRSSEFLAINSSVFGDIQNLRDNAEKLQTISRVKDVNLLNAILCHRPSLPLSFSVIFILFHFSCFLSHFFHWSLFIFFSFTATICHNLSSLS